MNIGATVFLILGAICELIAAFAPNLAANLVKNWMCLGFAFVILSVVVNVSISVAVK